MALATAALMDGCLSTQTLCWRHSCLSSARFAFAFLLVPALVILWYNGFDFQTIPTLSDGSGYSDAIHPLIYVAILGIVGTGLANIYFYKLIQMSSPIFASNVTYLIPIVATFWSLVFNENVTLLQIFGTAIILFGVYITNKK